MHEQALKAVTDLLGAQAVADHIIGTKQSEQVRVATILAVNAGGTLSTADVATVQSLAEP
jgi:hypothetical protein